MAARSILLVATLGLAVLACAAPQPAPSPADSGTPRYGGVLNARMPSDPFSFDPPLSGNTVPSSFGSAYESLVTFKNGPDVRFDEHVLAPELAERWEVSADARTFTFYLRKGVKFADLPPVHGREVSSADVRWTYDYWSRLGQFKDKKLPKSQFDWMLEGMDRVETPDSHTAIVRFQEPFMPFLTYAGTDALPVVPHEIYGQDGDLMKTMVGTGPFQLDMQATQNGSRWVWKKNPGYWQQGRPYLDEVRALILPDDAAAMAAFQTKRLDLLGSNNQLYSGTTVDEIKRANPQAVVSAALRDRPTHVYMNTMTEPLNDVRIRRALALAIDRDEYLRVVAGGRGGWALAGALTDLFTQEEVKQILRYDPAEAQRLVREAGYSGGVEVEVMFPSDRGQEYITNAELIQAQLKKGGINAVLRSLSWEEVTKRRRENKFAISVQSKAVWADPDSYIFQTFHPKSSSNYGGVSDPKLTAMIEAQRRETDPGKRREVLREGIRYIADQAWQAATIVEMNYQFWHPYLKNFFPHVGSSSWPVTHSWLEK